MSPENEEFVRKIRIERAARRAEAEVNYELFIKIRDEIGKLERTTQETGRMLLPAIQDIVRETRAMCAENAKARKQVPMVGYLVTVLVLAVLLTAQKFENRDVDISFPGFHFKSDSPTHTADKATVNQLLSAPVKEKKPEELHNGTENFRLDGKY